MPTVWRQTSNSIEVRLENSSAILKEGYGAFDFFKTGTQYFFTPPGGAINAGRNSSDPDFTLFYVDSANRIQQAASPLGEKYVAGWVNDTLIGNFVNTSEKSLIFIDHGREEAGKSYDEWEFSHLWRLDWEGGQWVRRDFAQELGRQFWHSSSNPIDVNGDGLQDFVVSALSSAVCVLFVSNATSGEFRPISLASHLPSQNSGASALIRLGNGNSAVISMPYSTDGGVKGDSGSILYLSTDGLRVESTKTTQVRSDQILSGMTNIEGFSTISVLDLNKDGLEDFVALAESRLGTLPDLKRLFAFVQTESGDFRLANNELQIPFTYRLPIASGDANNNTIGTRLSALDANADGELDLLVQPDLIVHSTLASSGIYGGLVYNNGVYEQLRIPASQIIFNNENPPYNYRSIQPTEINSDGVIDYVLIGTQYNQEKTSTNQYGEIYYVSLLLSETNNAEDNFFTASIESNQLDGGAGIDTCIFRGLVEQYEVLIGAGSGVRVMDKVSYRDGATEFRNIERLKFADKSLAVDIDGNAGQVAKILGAVFGESYVSNKDYVGIGLALLDGGMSYQDLGALAMTAAGKRLAADICGLLWVNVMGQLPSAADIAPFEVLLNSGQLSIGALVAMAADTSYNIANIDLVGLASDGIEYI